MAICPWTAASPPAKSLRQPNGANTTRTRVVIHSLPSRDFAIVWCTLLMVRCVCALYLLGLGRVYAVLSTDCMAYYANLLSPHAWMLCPYIAWFCMLLSITHGYQIAKTLIVSMRMRKLVFRDSTSRNGKVSPSRPKPVKPKPRWLQVYRSIFGRQGFFGAESSFFEFQFLLREIVEMVSQTSQVIQGSYLIGRPWINHVLVASLFVNSWSTPVIQHFTQRFPALERVLCLAADLVLDGIMNMVLPIVLELPYLRAFNAGTCNIDNSVLYSDVGVINMIMESRMVFVLSPIDITLKLVPHISIFLCLRSIQELLRPALESTEDADGKTHNGVAANCRGPRGGILKLFTRRSVLLSDLSLRIRRMQSRRLRGRQAMVVHAAFLIWGVLVLGMHIKTASCPNLAQENVPVGCMQPLRPWFAAKPACSVFHYDCKSNNVTSPNDESFDAIDELSIASIIISDCSALRMPSVLQKFSGLLEFEIWRSHIAHWGSEAAFTAQYHQHMFYCGIIKTTMVEIPEGLLLDLPAALQDIEFVHCNVSSLPDGIEIAWANVGTLYLEYCNFTEFPPVLLRMDIQELSLVGNQLTTLPELRSSYFTLALSNNPRIATFSDVCVCDMSGFSFLSLEYTAVTTLSPWINAMARRPGAKIHMFGTPFCADKSPIELRSEYGAEATLTCADVNPYRDGRYPLAFVEDLRLSYNVQA